MQSFTAVQKLAHTLLAALIAVLVISLSVMWTQVVHAAPITLPPVPDTIQVPAGNEPYLVGHAVGTQNYVCLPTDTGVAFKLFTPQATLFNLKGKQAEIATHYFSANPAQNGTVRATWQDSKDTSLVWGEVKPGNASSDPNFVAQGAIPWLLVTQVGTQAGPTGGDMLTETTYIQRINTTGGVAPTVGCAAPTDIGTSAFVRYTADYIFFRSAKK